MSKKSKIAIPTDDGVIIGPEFKGSRAFLVATVKEGVVIHQELRWNLLSEMMTSKHGYFYNLCDCNMVMVSHIGKGHTELLESRKIGIIHTDSSLIPEALTAFLESTFLLAGIK